MAVRGPGPASGSVARSRGPRPGRRTGPASRKRPSPPRWREYLAAIGPGFITGASDDDPSGIATYSQVGARFGLAFLWTALLTLPLMVGIQEICDRTALATGYSLGELAVKRFARVGRTIIGALLIALIVANALNIAADLVAIGSGMQLLHAGPTAVWALIAGLLVTALIALGTFARIALVFKVLAAALLSYLVVAVVVTHNWGNLVSHTFIPEVHWSRAYLALLVAALGTTISPYLFFWQSAHRLEEMRDEPQGGTQAVPLPRMTSVAARRKQGTSRLDVVTGMSLSNLVMFAIIAASAQTLHAHGKTNIQSAAQAAAALQPFAGHLSSILFALGFIGSGLLAVPVLAGAGSAGLAGLLGKQWGFSRSVRGAPVFYGLVAIGTLGSTALSLLHVNPIGLLVVVAVINGVAAAPFLVVVMLISGNRRLMQGYVNGKVATVIGWLTVAIMAVAAVALFASGGVSL